MDSPGKPGEANGRGGSIIGVPDTGQVGTDSVGDTTTRGDQPLTQIGVFGACHTSFAAMCTA
jgi:hypothetical protein